MRVHYPISPRLSSVISNPAPAPFQAEYVSFPQFQTEPHPAEPRQSRLSGQQKHTCTRGAGVPTQINNEKEGMEAQALAARAFLMMEATVTDGRAPLAIHLSAFSTSML